MKIPFLCKIGLHWPLHRKCKAFRDQVTGLQVYVCHCNCNKYWLATGRYKFFKVVVDKPQAWLNKLPDHMWDEEGFGPIIPGK